MDTKELVTQADLIPDLDGEGKAHIELPEGAELRQDQNREIRAMLLAVHPCPPLPQIALGELKFEERVFSSHDFLATAIDRMLIKKDTQFNRSRRSAQHQLIMSHFDELEAIGSEGLDANRLYECFTGFSRKYAAVFFNEAEQKRIDIRYKPLDHVCRNDPVHLSACSHLRAYRIMRNQEPWHPKEFEELSYAEVLCEFQKEVVRKDPEDEVDTETDKKIRATPINSTITSIPDAPIEIVRAPIVETRSVGTTTIAGILPPVKRLLPDTIVASPIVADPIVTDPIVADTEI
jgi:hypothetical protein